MTATAGDRPVGGRSGPDGTGGTSTTIDPLGHVRGGPHRSDGDRFRRAAGTVSGLLVVGAVLAVDPAGWYPFGPVKWALVSTLVLAASVSALGRSLRCARPVGSDRRSPRVLDGAMVVFVAAMAAAALVGEDDLYAWTGTPERNAGVLLWVLCVLALLTGEVIGSSRPETGAAAALDAATGLATGTGRVVRGVLVAGAAIGAVSVAEALGWEPGVFDVGSRLTATMGSSAYLGATAALLVPVAVALAVAPGTARALRVLAGAATVGLAVAAVGSGARSAWVGLAVALVATVVARRRVLLRHRKLVVRAGLALAAGVAVVLAVTPAGPRLVALTDADAAGGRGRLDEWRIATAVLAEHPITGVGPEGYRIAFSDGVDADYQDRHGRDPLPDRAHSGPLDVALAGGPVALAAWVVVLVTVGRSAWRALRSGRAVDVGLAAALAAHWTGQLFLFPLAELEPIAWLFAGIVVARDRCRCRRPPAQPTPATSDRGARAVRSVLTVGAVVALLAGASAVAADRQAATAASTGSIPAAERAVSLRPDHLRHHLLLARVRLAGDEGYVAALDALEGARTVSPRDPVLRRAEARYLVGRALATEVPDHAEIAHRHVWGALADDPLDTEMWAIAMVLAVAMA